MKKILAGMFVCMLLLAGCGSSDDDKKIDKITGKEQLIVAMDCASAPYTYLVENQNDHTVAFGESLYASGYDVLVARDLAKSLNKELVIKKMTMERAEKALENDEIDIIMGGLLKDSSKEDLDYTSVYYETGVSLIVRKDDKKAAASELKEFKNTKIAGVKGSYGNKVISQIKGVKKQKAKDSYSDLIKAMNDKKLDGMIAETETAKLVTAQNPGLVIVNFKEGKGFKTEKGVVMAVKKDNELKDGINKFIKKLKDDKKKEYMDTAKAASPAILKAEEPEKK